MTRPEPVDVLSTAAAIQGADHQSVTGGRDARECPSSGATGAIVIGGAYGSIAIARSLGRRGIPVWFFNSGHPIASFSRYVRRSPVWPANPEQQIAYLLEPATRNQLQGWTLFPG